VGRGRHTFLWAKTNFNNNLILFLLLKNNQPVTGLNPPANIEVIEPTDKCCISLNITEGLARIESFHVYVNDTQQFTLLLPAKTYVTPVPQTVVIGKKSIWVTNKIKLQ
jgi:hypothetical protein